MTLRSFVFALGAAAALAAVSCAHHHSPLSPSSLEVSGVTPAAGSSFGGTGITVHGDGFAPGVSVTFGGVPGTNVVILDAQDLTVVTPAHIVGVVPIAVTLNGRTAGLVNGFTYGSPALGDNPPPVIQSITSSGLHPNQPNQYAEQKEPLTITATVLDNETSPDALQYDWSAPLGTFSGEGATVLWQPPLSKAPPFDVTITLTVTEHFKTPDSHGLPVDQTNVVIGTFDVFVHDAKSEVGDMGQDFLDLFSNSNLGADQVLHNFDPNCLTGTDNERLDVINNRLMFKILTGNIQNLTQMFTLNFGGVCTGLGAKFRSGDACAYYHAHWTQTLIDGTPAPPTDGTDQVAAFYRNNKWVLCTSEFGSPNNANTMFKR